MFQFEPKAEDIKDFRLREFGYPSAFHDDIGYKFSSVPRITNDEWIVNLKSQFPNEFPQQEPEFSIPPVIFNLDNPNNPLDCLRLSKTGLMKRLVSHMY